MPERTARMVETMFGCKWSKTVYKLLAHGTNRPGEMARCVEGLSTKVLNDCLKRNTDFGILERVSYPELPPRVEYSVTTFGDQFIRVLDSLGAQQEQLNMVETIYSCKWSLTVYKLLAHGINRPGEMVRSVEGLTTKVLNACLRRNIDFGILERVSYPELPPRVEYNVTTFGDQFISVLDTLEALQEDLSRKPHNFSM